MREIKEGDLVLARHISEADCKDGLNFFSSDNEFIQVGFWGYDSGKKLLAHIHNEVERKVYIGHKKCFLSKKVKLKLESMTQKKTLSRNLRQSREIF